MASGINASRRELESKRLSELSAMAREVGLDDRSIERAMDDLDPKSSLIDQIMSAPPKGAAGGGTTATTVDRRQFEGKRLSELATMAKDAGLDPRKVDAAMDAPNPKAVVIDLLCGGGGGRPNRDSPGISRRELADKKLSELEQMAKDAGVDRRELDRAMDGRNAKDDVIELIMAASDKGGGGGGGGA